MNTSQEKGIYRIFLLTVWQDIGDQHEEDSWRFVLGDPRSGERNGFASKAALVDGLLNLVEETKQDEKTTGDLSTNPNIWPQENKTMPWKQRTLAHTTMVGTYRLIRLPCTSREEFINTLRDEVLGSATQPGLQRDTNVVSQNLLTSETTGDVDICLWKMYFSGVRAPDAVRADCEAIYDSVREKLEVVGTRISFELETLEGSWIIE